MHHHPTPNLQALLGSVSPCSTLGALPRFYPHFPQQIQVQASQQLGIWLAVYTQQHFQHRAQAQTFNTVWACPAPPCTAQLAN
jgi:hypothetical protein